jgi:formylglycine-generating enzyme required for sulfatase activity
LWLVRGDDADVRSLYISKSPITNEEYEAFDPSHRRAVTSRGDRDPVVDVSFRDALAYCRWYSRASGKAFRLPTEGEWEFACRAGTTGPWFWGDQPDAGDPFVWDAATSGGRCREVETSRANPNGLHDMLGNVWEWTASAFLAEVASPASMDDPGAPGPRAIRGGSFRTDRRQLGSALRAALDPQEHRDDLGFRIARML